MTDQPHSLPDISHVRIDPHRPVILVDVDEVLARFVQGFQSYVQANGYDMNVDKYALFGSIFSPGASQSVDMETGKRLFDGFFRDGSDHLLPHEGGRESLERLSARASVVILSNAPAHGQTARRQWLDQHGFNYPLVLNSGLKGPAAKALATQSRGRSAFIDDILHNLDSVADHVPGIATFQMVADDRLRPVAPMNAERHARHDTWPELEQALEKALF